MVDWTSGTADASIAERLTAFLPIRVPGSPDVFKETPVTQFLSKDTVGVLAIPDEGFDEKLRIKGANSYISFLDTTGTTRRGYIGNFSGNTYIWNDGAGAVIFGLSGVEAARFSDIGYFGLGTNAPGFRLHVKGASDTTHGLIAGVSKGIRFQTATTGSIIEGVDQTGGVSYQPLTVGGSVFNISISGITQFQFTATQFLPASDNTKSVGSAAARFSTIYAATGTINTSDERVKTAIEGMPDEWLDAWGDVEWCRFKFVDGMRWHVGLIAQRVHATFAAHNLDAFEIGLCCYDEWQEQRETIWENVKKTRLVKVEKLELAGENEDREPLFERVEVVVEEEYEEAIDTGQTRVALEAGNRWGLRYDECQAIEAAWQRREIARLADRLAQLEAAAT